MLPWWRMAAYGMPALPLSIVGLPLNVYLPGLYTAGLGLSLSTVGLVLLAVRLGDVITDPYWPDGMSHTRTMLQSLLGLTSSTGVPRSSSRLFCQLA